jgi:hypothetical protein
MVVTTTSFLLQPFNLCSEGTIEKAISDNLWLKLPYELKEYIPTSPYELKSFNVRVRRSKKREISAYFRKNPRHFREDDFVALEFRAKWSEEDFEDMIADREARGLDAHQSRVAAARMLSNICLSLAQRMIVLMNISSPGYSKTSFSILESKGLLFEVGEGCFSWLEYASYEEENFLARSKPIFDQEPQAFFDWAKQINGFWDNLPSTNVERSLSYFSYIFTSEHHSNYFETLPWIIGCLDALYCETNTGISEKLKNRIPIILNDLTKQEIVKAVNKVYQDRSRIVHGDSKFVANFSDPYELSDVGSSYIMLFDSLPLMLYLIIRTLRFCVEKNLKSLDFSETVRL